MSASGLTVIFRTQSDIEANVDPVAARQPGRGDGAHVGPAVRACFPSP